MTTTPYSLAKKLEQVFSYQEFPTSDKLNDIEEDIRLGIQAHRHTGADPANSDDYTDGHASKISRTELEADVLLVHARGSENLAVDGSSDTLITTDLDTIEQVFVTPRGTEQRMWTVHSIVDAAGASTFKIRWGFAPASPTTFTFDWFAIGTKA